MALDTARRATGLSEVKSPRPRPGTRHQRAGDVGAVHQPASSHLERQLRLQDPSAPCGSRCRITRCTCAAAAVAARARRLNRLLAQAALVPHQHPRPTATMCLLCGSRPSTGETGSESRPQARRPRTQHFKPVRPPSLDSLIRQSASPLSDDEPSPIAEIGADERPAATMSASRRDPRHSMILRRLTSVDGELLQLCLHRPTDSAHGRR